MKSFVLHAFLLISYVVFVANFVVASRIRGSSSTVSSELPGDEDSTNGFREHPKRSLKILTSSSPSPLPFKGEDGVFSRTGGYFNSKTPTSTPTKAPTSAPTKLKLEPIRKEKLEAKKIQKLSDAVAMTKRKFDPPVRRFIDRPARERGAKRVGGLGRHHADKLVKTGSNETVKRVGITRQANPSTTKVENPTFRGIQPRIKHAESLAAMVEPEIPEASNPEIPETETPNDEKLKNDKINHR